MTDNGLVWAALRATRAEPPAGIKADRRKTYVAALEQAQQMFTAAATIGVATRPLLLFYGLSQGGRAIAAAAKDVPDKDYRLVGHGIKVNQSTLGGPIADIHIYGDNSAKGSFTRLSRILKSSSWDDTAPVSLGELWNSLPEGSTFALDHSLGGFPLSANVDEFSVVSEAENAPPVRLAVSGIPADMMPSSQPATLTPALQGLLDRYPTLAGYTKIDITGIFPGSQRGTVHLTYPSSHTDFSGRTADALIHCTLYGMHERYAFPAVGANTDSQHPVMAWWAVLFALSMLARYHPEAWASHIAVDQSSAAVPIEQLLTAALTTVPELLLRTILDV
ncbi:hypothetical protein ILP97_00280 [Amycolatopsis sp. H6(2020)]|nr:hypothetical protein [Amycolatopsis sp. H6(2020)]